MQSDTFLQQLSAFCDSWGNIASVVGLAITVLGFVFTIWGVVRAKRAAEQAEVAANLAKDRVLKQGTLANFSSAIGTMEDIMRLNRKQDWHGVLERQFELRRTLVELKSGGGGLTDGQQTIIQGSVEQLKSIQKAIEKFVSNGKPQPNVAKFNDIITGEIEKLHEISISLMTS